MVWHELGVTWPEVGFGVVSGLGIYAGVVVLTRLFGQRTLATMSSYDFPVVVATGAIIGRIALARTSLLGGLVALVTLFLAQLFVSMLRTHLPAGIIDNRPIALVVDGAIQFDLLGKALMEQDDVSEKLRLAGVHRLDEVRLLVLERSGGLSTVRGGEGVDLRLLQHVVGAERMRTVEQDRGDE